ncbi:uncharacterized protein LOC144292196 isoform X6 [Canis aureus]
MTQAHMSSGFQPGLPMGSHPLGIRKGKEDENVSVSEMTASMGGSREWNYYGDSTGFNTRYPGHSNRRKLERKAIRSWEM